MIIPCEARKMILSQIQVLPAVTVLLSDSLNRVLAEEVVASEDVPPFTNSAMDGFALRARDLEGVSSQRPVKLKVLADLPAGHPYEGEVRSGEAIRIMTGAPLPIGTDSVVKVEDARSEGESVILEQPLLQGTNVRLQGEDVVRGSLVLSQGERLRPALIGVLATLGRSTVRVYPPARVAIITTGDELVEYSLRPGPGQIRDANSPGLAAQVREIGATPLPYPRIADQRNAVRQALQDALEKADLVLTSGGVSVGDYDFVKEVLDELGGERIFWGVAQKPGKPLAFWLVQGKPIVGLPGNPVSSMLCLEEYVRPALRKMMGHRHLFRPEREGILAEAYRKDNDGRQHFLRVTLAEREGSLYATPTGPQGSGVLTSMARAQALAIIPAEATFTAKGSPVTLQMTDWPEDLLSC